MIRAEHGDVGAAGCKGTLTRQRGREAIGGNAIPRRAAVGRLENHVWIGTTASRVLRSADGGRSWAIATTPVATGNATGIFSIAFKDAQHGVVVGGDYTKESQAGDNAAFTSDGGATWTLGKGITGFRSVAAWVPGTRSIFAIGPAGADRSIDDGQSWTPVVMNPAAGFDSFSLAPGTTVGWASGSGGRIAKLPIAD